METLAIARHREHAPLIAGNKLTCPRCGTAQIIGSYFVFDRPKEYADELNVVLKCRAKVRQPSGRIEPCRCIFSITDNPPEATDA